MKSTRNFMILLQLTVTSFLLISLYGSFKRKSSPNESASDTDNPRINRKVSIVSIPYVEKLESDENIWVNTEYRLMPLDLARKIKQIRKICQDQRMELAGTRWCRNISHFSTVKNVPEVLMIGAPKSGTTMTSRFLGEHPFIITPVGELRFFGRNDTDLSKIELSRVIPPSVENQLCYARDPLFLQNPEVPKQVASFLSNDIKLIVLLREPVERTISHHAHVQALKYRQPLYETYTTVNGSTFVNASTINIIPSTYIVGLENWLEYFPLENFLFISTEEMMQDPLREMKKIEKFIGLPSWFDADSFYMRNDTATICNQSTMLRRIPTIERNGKIFKIDMSSLNIQTVYGCIKFSHQHHYFDENYLNPLRTFFKPYNERLFKVIGKRFNW